MRSLNAHPAVSSMLAHQRAGLERGQRYAQARLFDERPCVTVASLPARLLLERGKLSIHVEVERRSSKPAGRPLATSARLAEWPVTMWLRHNQNIRYSGATNVAPEQTWTAPGSGFSSDRQPSLDERQAQSLVHGTPAHFSMATRPASCQQRGELPPGERQPSGSSGSAGRRPRPGAGLRRPHQSTKSTQPPLPGICSVVSKLS